MATTGRFSLYGRKGLRYYQDGVASVSNTSYVEILGINAQGLPTLKLGTSTAAVSDTSAGNLANFYYTNSATSGDSRAVYAKLTLTGASGMGGEAGRFYALTSGKPDSLHGVHATAQVLGGTGVAGEAAGLRATIASTTGLTLSAGTYAALRLDSDLNSALNATDASWIYITDLQSNKIGMFINAPTVDTSTMYIAAGTSAGSAGKSDGCAAQKVLTCKIGGSLVYIPVFTQNT